MWSTSSRFGGSTVLKTLTLGAIGPDRYGSEMLTMLADEGVIVEHVAQSLRTLAAEGEIAILLIEQNLGVALVASMDIVPAP